LVLPKGLTGFVSLPLCRKLSIDKLQISIDHYLRSGNVNESQQPPTNQPPPEAAEYMLGRDVGFD
jgi:hypothetical protein